jgi:hypothetical protein
VRRASATVGGKRSKETTMRRRTRTVGAAAAVALAMGATGVDARAAVSDEHAAKLQRQIDRVLAHSAPGGRSRRVHFFHYRLYRLAAYGMRPGKRRGASSYANHQTGGARAWLTFFNSLHEPFDIELFSNGSLHGRLNDAAHYIELAP